MKVSSRIRPRLTRLILTTAVVAPMALPYGVSAASPSQQAQQALKASTECTKVQTFGQNALNTIATRTNKMQTDSASDAAKRQQQWASYDTQIASDRANWDNVRQQNFAKLSAEAKTSTSQSAVSTFEQTVLGDVTTRRSAVDDARNTYRSTVTQDASARLAGLLAAVSTFKGAVQTAMNTAQASCTAGNTTGVGTTFVASMKQARMSFNAAISAVPKLTPQVQAAGQTRDATIKQADSTFQSQVQQAAGVLKSALGQ
jgi:hypothetical protein